MGIYRTSNVAEWDDVEGIIIDESAPAPSVQGVSANVVLLVGQFQRGSYDIQQPTSIGEFHEMYGKSNALGNIALKNKKFGQLKIARVMGAGAKEAEHTFVNGATGIIKFLAKYPGLYGNNIRVTVTAGTGGTSTYTVEDTNVGSVDPKEVYANIPVASLTPAVFARSKLIDVEVLATSAEPTPGAGVLLTTGVNGTVSDTSYEEALAAAEVEGVCNVVFLDEYTAIRNGYLKVHAANTGDRMVITSSALDADLTDAIADVGSLRDTAARIIHAFNPVQTTIDGVPTYTSPASWLASVFSQTPAHVSLASVDTADFMAGATGVFYQLNRTNFILAKEAGIAAFENVRGSIRVKSAVTTQIADSSKHTILRRRMADYLTNSIGIFLQNYQDKVNKKSNRKEVGAQIHDFVARHEREGILPSDAEVSKGKAKLIDTESGNTDSSIAAGFFKIIYKQRIFSSMRFIVLQAEIGESVVVTEV